MLTVARRSVDKHTRFLDVLHSGDLILISIALAAGAAGELYLSYFLGFSKLARLRITGRLLPYFNAGGVFMVFTGGAILYAALYRTPGTEPADQGSVSWTVFAISLLSAASAVVVNANLEQSLEEISEEP